jgi:hypothetical protein
VEGQSFNKNLENQKCQEIHLKYLNQKKEVFQALILLLPINNWGLRRYYLGYCQPFPLSLLIFSLKG